MFLYRIPFDVFGSFAWIIRFSVNRIGFRHGKYS